MESISWDFFEFCIPGGVTLDVLWLYRLEVKKKICWSVQAVLLPLFSAKFHCPISSNTFAFFLFNLYLPAFTRQNRLEFTRFL